jgi:hypothetical protein
MKFTKEEIETVKKIYCNWNSKQWDYFCDYADSLLKPETKKIVVEIEYDERPDAKPNAQLIQEKIQTLMFNFKVTELPEVFSRLDMIDFANYNSDYPEFLTANNLSRFLLERNK